MERAPSTAAHQSVNTEVLRVARQVADVVRRIIPDPAYQVLLFGSWAAGTARERSDIDIGIEGPRAVPPAVMIRIREACEELTTLYVVDVVDMSQLSSGVRQLAMARTMRVEEL